MNAEIAAKYQTLLARAGIGEGELQMRWVESGMEWAEWINHTLLEIDAIERSLAEADAGIVATPAEVDAVFNLGKYQSQPSSPSLRSGGQ